MSQKQEVQWEQLLKIRTTGRDESHADQFCYPYEPTPYSVLNRLAGSGLIQKKNVLLDYGCGKGRVDFFLSYQTRCRSIGIEYDERIYASALENKKRGVSTDRVSFFHADAGSYEVPENVDRIFFFNPFSIEILKSVFARILDSFYAAPRELLLFFYYPSEDFVSFLMTQDNLMFYDEIDCRDLFDGEDLREKILIFEMITW